MLAYTYIRKGKFALKEKTPPALRADGDAIVKITLAWPCCEKLMCS